MREGEARGGAGGERGEVQGKVQSAVERETREGGVGPRPGGPACQSGEDGAHHGALRDRSETVRERTMGESLSVSIPIDGDHVRGEIFLEKSIQRGLQRRVEARDCFAFPVLAIATRRPPPRRVRDPEGDHPRDGIRPRRRYADAHRRRFGAPRR